MVLSWPFDRSRLRLLGPKQAQVRPRSEAGGRRAQFHLPPLAAGQIGWVERARDSVALEEQGSRDASNIIENDGSSGNQWVQQAHHAL